MPGTSNSGRKKTPTAILAKRGSWRAKGRLKTEPVALPESFIEPSEMSELMRDFYNTYVPLLQQSGIISGTDSLAFESMARNWCRLQVLNNRIGDGDESFKMMFNVIENKHGRKHLGISGLIKLQLELERLVWSQFREFGLTPTSRPNIEKIQVNRESVKKLT